MPPMALTNDNAANATRSWEEQMMIEQMMRELGNARLDTLPLQDHPGEDGCRNRSGAGGYRAASRPGASSVPKQDIDSEWANAILAGDFEDDDAEMVKDLDLMGGGRLHAQNQGVAPSRPGQLLPHQRMLKPTRASPLGIHTDIDKPVQIRRYEPGYTPQGTAGPATTPAARPPVVPAPRRANTETPAQDAHRSASLPRQMPSTRGGHRQLAGQQSRPRAPNGSFRLPGEASGSVSASLPQTPVLPDGAELVSERAQILLSTGPRQCNLAPVWLYWLIPEDSPTREPWLYAYLGSETHCRFPLSQWKDYLHSEGSAYNIRFRGPDSALETIYIKFCDSESARKFFEKKKEVQEQFDARTNAARASTLAQLEEPSSFLEFENSSSTGPPAPASVPDPPLANGHAPPNADVTSGTSSTEIERSGVEETERVVTASPAADLISIDVSPVQQSAPYMADIPTPGDRSVNPEPSQTGQDDDGPSDIRELCVRLIRQSANLTNSLPKKINGLSADLKCQLEEVASEAFGPLGGNKGKEAAAAFMNFLGTVLKNPRHVYSVDELNGLRSRAELPPGSLPKLRAVAANGGGGNASRANRNAAVVTAKASDRELLQKQIQQIVTQVQKETNRVQSNTALASSSTAADEVTTAAKHPDSPKQGGSRTEPIAQTQERNPAPQTTQASSGQKEPSQNKSQGISQGVARSVLTNPSPTQRGSLGGLGQSRWASETPYTHDTQPPTPVGSALLDLATLEQPESSHNATSDQPRSFNTQNRVGSGGSLDEMSHLFRTLSFNQSTTYPVQVDGHPGNGGSQSRDPRDINKTPRTGTHDSSTLI